VPVTVSIDEAGAWLISRHGYRSGWTRNIAADPNVPAGHRLTRPRATLPA
jgi:hypothetical protein